MSEAKRRFDMKMVKPGEQIQVDAAMLKDATPRKCECGSDLFEPAIRLFTISALLSPIGREMIAQVPILTCKKCGTILDLASGMAGQGEV